MGSNDESSVRNSFSQFLRYWSIDKEDPELYELLVSDSEGWTR
jgi:hypothetical protein